MEVEYEFSKRDVMAEATGQNFEVIGTYDERVKSVDRKMQG